MSIAAGSTSHTINVTLKAFLKGSIDKEKVFEATTIINVIQCQYTGALTSLFLDSTSPLDVIYNSSSDESKLLILNRVTSSESICSTTIELTSATPTPTYTTFAISGQDLHVISGNLSITQTILLTVSWKFPDLSTALTKTGSVRIL